VSVLNREEILHQIASEERFITKMQQKYDRIASLETGVRSSSVSTDLAMNMIARDNAEGRIEALKAKLVELDNENT